MACLEAEDEFPEVVGNTCKEELLGIPPTCSPVEMVTFQTFKETIPDVTPSTPQADSWQLDSNAQCRDWDNNTVRSLADLYFPVPRFLQAAWNIPHRQGGCKGN